MIDEGYYIRLQKPLLSSRYFYIARYNCAIRENELHIPSKGIKM